jgi:hypothetical protein
LPLLCLQLEQVGQERFAAFLNGLLTVLARLLNGQSLTLGRLHPIPFVHFKDFAWSDSSMVVKYLPLREGVPPISFDRLNPGNGTETRN